MIGVVGKLLFKYKAGGENYSFLIDPVDTELIRLPGAENNPITVDGITYIVDTVYGVEISTDEDEWYVSGNSPQHFNIPSASLFGTVELYFGNRQK